MLVYNDGLGATAHALQADPDAIDAMLQLNVLALIRLTHAVVPKFASVTARAVSPRPEPCGGLARHHAQRHGLGHPNAVNTR
ncbi:MAG: family oxidoreductase [Rhodoferax sp.]|nr:family oxidoreductase [Rhodoferax sp.]